MSVVDGRRIGPYEIVSLLGAGGMGEVYLATDTRLDRSVAIKILPAHLRSNPQLKERFEREARAISALSHPNICALYDVGTEDDVDYLVMEYLEGETLFERLARGPLPASQVLRLGAQIADALHKAHRSGVTHRDLKPGNIMLTGSGAKLLDFGLAKIVAPAERVFSEHSAPETRNGPLTAEGAIVGTFHYMSPEQVEGKTVDHRSDIFSLGVILYEMATGRRPFRGDSPASLISAILASDPPSIRSLQPNVTPALDRIILTALEKHPDDRWQTAHDLGLQLRWIAESSSGSELAGAPKSSRGRSATLIGTAIAAALITAAAMYLAIPRDQPHVSGVRLDFVPPPEVQLQNHPELRTAAISPDGRSLVFQAGPEETSSLYLRDIDSASISRIEGSEGATSPFWSSDGEWIGFSNNGSLWKTRVRGRTPPEVVCEISPAGAQASWQGDAILFADSRGDRKEIYLVRAGSEPVAVTSLQPGEWRHLWPVLLPDGQHFLYLSSTVGTLDRALVLASLDSTVSAKLLSNTSQASLSGDDTIAYVRDGTLLEQRFDLEGQRMVSDPTTLATDVVYFYPTARAEFDASTNGVVIYRSDTSRGRLLFTDRQGHQTRLLDDSTNFWDHAISPDGARAAVTTISRGTGLMDIWIYDLVRGVRERFAGEPFNEVFPTWTPDGKSIVYGQAEGGTFPHLVLRRIGGPTAEDLTPRDSFQAASSFSPDGATLYYERDPGTGSRVYALSMANRESKPLLGSSYHEAEPAVSPDGVWLAYSSTTTGNREIYLHQFSDETSRIRVSDSGGSSPRWRKDGRELFYLSSDGRIISAVPGLDNTWNGATTTELFRYPAEIHGFDVTPDGDMFLISDWTPGPSDASIHVIVGRETEPPR